MGSGVRCFHQKARQSGQDKSFAGLSAITSPLSGCVAFAGRWLVGIDRAAKPRQRGRWGPSRRSERRSSRATESDSAAWICKLLQTIANIASGGLTRSARGLSRCERVVAAAGGTGTSCSSTDEEIKGIETVGDRTSAGAFARTIPPASLHRIAANRRSVRNVRMESRRLPIRL